MPGGILPQSAANQPEGAAGATLETGVVLWPGIGVTGLVVAGGEVLAGAGEVRVREGAGDSLVVLQPSVNSITLRIRTEKRIGHIFLICLS